MEKIILFSEKYYFISSRLNIIHKNYPKKCHIILRWMMLKRAPKKTKTFPLKHWKTFPLKITFFFINFKKYKIKTNKKSNVFHLICPAKNRNISQHFFKFPTKDPKNNIFLCHIFINGFWICSYARDFVYPLKIKNPN